MRIAICIKHVPVDSKVEIDPVTHNLIRNSAAGEINPCDKNAMEVVRRIKEATGADVDAYTMGPEDAIRSLHYCLALGADKAYLLSDKAFAGGDTLATARVLGEALKQKGPYDLVFTGAESNDGATGQVGPMIAQYLGIPDVAEAIEVKAEDDKTIKVDKKVEGSTYHLTVKTPVLLTVPFGANEHELPTLRNQVAANQHEIITITNKELGLDENLIGKKGSLSVVTDTVKNQEAQTAERITGSPKEIAAKITALISERRKANV